MNYFLRNNIDDFYRWHRHIVPYARAELYKFKVGKSVALFPDDYDEALRVKRQLHNIKAQLDFDHDDYLEEVLIKRGTSNLSNSYERKLYYDIFEVWRAVCFSKGKSRIKTIDPVLLGGEMMKLRANKCIPAKHVADLVGVAEKTLYCYEEGIRMMRVDAFFKLCQIYKTNPESILKNATV